jgi:hypothetical protein
MPGQNWKFCPSKKSTKEEKAASCPPAIGSPGRDSIINVISAPQKVKTIDPITASPTTEEYVKVEFSYDRVVDGVKYHQSGTGYMDTTYLSKKKTKSFYSARNSPKTICPPDSKDPQSKIKAVANQIADLQKSTQNLSISGKAEALSEVVGFCPLKPPTEMPKFKDTKKNIYDEKILPVLLSLKIPKITDETGKPISREQMIEIDSLARTLYGEMAICYRRGLQYPMAVAKMILNRAKNTARAGEFIQPPHSERAPPITQVCTTPSQFSMWLKNIKNVGANEPLHHGFCPPTKKDEPYWNSDAASGFEYDIWKNTMRIATEAILYPSEFEKRTSEITGYHYTSGIGKFYNMTQVKPTIEGKKIERSECLEIWKEKEKKSN